MRRGLIGIFVLLLPINAMMGIGPPSAITVASERLVLEGYDEPNTPPHGAVRPALAQAITDPAARAPDGTINLNKAIVVRFFAVEPPASLPPRAIVLLFPDLLAGANSLSILASEIVKASLGEIECWAMDRRSNLLEDATAMIEAESRATREASLAALAAYTNHPAGRGGYVAATPFEVSPFMAEWGLDVHLRDARVVVAEARSRVGAAGKVFLGGGFLGAAMAQAFAAYNFDGVAGFSLIDGLVLLDFALAPSASGALIRLDPIPDDIYLNGGMVPDSPNLILRSQAVTGVNRLRHPQRRFNISDPTVAGDEPFVVGAQKQPTTTLGASRFLPIDPYALQLIEIAAQLSLWDPEGETTVGPPYVAVRATNEAAFALSVDDEFQQVNPARSSIGFLRIPPGRTLSDIAVRQADPGPPAGANPNGLFAPRDLGSMPQRWARLSDLLTIGLQGAEPSELESLARSFLYGSGRATLADRLPNFLEWYMPTRLLLDTLGIAPLLDASRFSPAVRAALMANGGRGLALTENQRVNLPVLALRAGQGLIQGQFFFTAEQIFTSLLDTYRRSTSIAADRIKVKATQFPTFAHGDLYTSTAKGTEGKSVAEYIVDFALGRL